MITRENAVLMAFKPNFAEKIFSGEKKFEIRRYGFKKPVQTIIMYLTSPIRKIVGEFEIEEILKKDISSLWGMLATESGISRQEFFDYFSKSRTGVAIKIGKVTKYDKEIDPFTEYEKFSPPQSFRYLS